MVAEICPRCLRQGFFVSPAGVPAGGLLSSDFQVRSSGRGWAVGKEQKWECLSNALEISLLLHCVPAASILEK